MEIIISSIALVVSMIALWMAVEARKKSSDEVKTFVVAFTDPLRQELTEAKNHIDKITRNQNRLIKKQTSNTQEISELRRQLTIKKVPHEKPRKSETSNSMKL